MPPTTIALTDSQKVTLAVSFSAVDAKGQPVAGGAPLAWDAPPTWTSDTPGAVTAALNADNSSGDLAAVAPGSATVSVKGTVGGLAAAGSALVTVGVGAATAVAVSLTAGPITSE